MAEKKSIHEAQQVLEDRVLELVTIVKTFDAIAGDHLDYPDWLAVMFGRVLDIDAASQEYMGAVHEAMQPESHLDPADVPSASSEPT